MTIQIDKKLTNFVRPSAHAPYGPSSADRWMACAGSIKQCKGIVEQSSKYAIEGTLAHTVCEELFAERFYSIPMSDHLKMEMIGLEDQGAEMMECAEAYVDLIESWLRMESELGKILYFGLERGIPVFPEEHCFGTADCLIVGTKGAAIIDLKYGKGKEVGAQSTQLKIYALGVYNHVKGVPDDYKWNAVVFQPRISIIAKCAEYSNEEMKEFSNEVYDAILETKKEGAELIAGNHCFWCPAKRTREPSQKCPLIKQKTIDLANENFDSFLTDMSKEEVSKDTRDEAMLKLISLFPLIKDTVEAAKEELMYRMDEKGEAIMGVMVRDVKGRRKWKHDKTKDIEADIVNTFPEYFPEGKATKVKESILSMTDVKKIVGKANHHKIDELMITPMKKELIIQDEKVQEILKSLSNYSQMITNGN